MLVWRLCCHIGPVHKTLYILSSLFVPAQTESRVWIVFYTCPGCSHPDSPMSTSEACKTEGAPDAIDVADNFTVYKTPPPTPRAVLPTCAVEPQAPGVGLVVPAGGHDPDSEPSGARGAELLVAAVGGGIGGSDGQGDGDGGLLGERDAHTTAAASMEADSSSKQVRGTDSEPESELSEKCSVAEVLHSEPIDPGAGRNAVRSPQFTVYRTYPPTHGPTRDHEPQALGVGRIPYPPIGGDPIPIPGLIGPIPFGESNPQWSWEVEETTTTVTESKDVSLHRNDGTFHVSSSSTTKVDKHKKYILKRKRTVDLRLRLGCNDIAMSSLKLLPPFHFTFPHGGEQCHVKCTFESCPGLTVKHCQCETVLRTP